MEFKLINTDLSPYIESSTFRGLVFFKSKDIVSINKSNLTIKQKTPFGDFSLYTDASDSNIRASLTEGDTDGFKWISNFAPFNPVTFDFIAIIIDGWATRKPLDPRDFLTYQCDGYTQLVSSSEYAGVRSYDANSNFKNIIHYQDYFLADERSPRTDRFIIIGDPQKSYTKLYDKNLGYTVDGRGLQNVINFSYENSFYSLDVIQTGVIATRKFTYNTQDSTWIRKAVALPQFIDKEIFIQGATEILYRVDTVSENIIASRYGSAPTKRRYVVEYNKLTKIKTIHREPVPSETKKYNIPSIAGYLYLDKPITLEPPDPFIGDSYFIGIK